MAAVGLCAVEPVDEALLFSLSDTLVPAGLNNRSPVVPAPSLMSA
ncbi:hypothetical protein [Streptomyces sioyaensis]